MSKAQKVFEDAGPGLHKCIYEECSKINTAIKKAEIECHLRNFYQNTVIVNVVYEESKSIIKNKWKIIQQYKGKFYYICGYSTIIARTFSAHIGKFVQKKHVF